MIFVIILINYAMIINPFLNFEIFLSRTLKKRYAFFCLQINFSRISSKKRISNRLVNKSQFKILAWVICEPWFTGSRDLCELWKYVNHKSKFTEKFGSRTFFKFFYSNNREPNFSEPDFC